MSLEFLSGNEAVARGAWEAGAAIGVGYPGTPSTETLENFVKYPEVIAQWAPNEKVALEVAAGASFGGARTLVTMKHVGLNVAADPLFTMAYIGVNGGVVVLVADDPGMHSSQNEQDSHNYAAFAHVPMFDPADPAEALAFTKLAFDVSEQFDVVTLIRSTVRVAHTKQQVETAERIEKEVMPFQRNPEKWVMMPGYARIARVSLDARIESLKEFADSFEGNRIEMRDSKVGVICSGVCYHYVRDALPDASILKLGMTYPLPENLLKKFASQVERIVIIEEADDYLVRSVRAMGIECDELPIPRRGELSAGIIHAAMGNEVAPCAPTASPARPPLLCAGCPHRSVFHVLKKMNAIVTGDIGCYTLGAVPPLSAIDTCVDMGASIPMAHGLALAQNKGVNHPIVAVIGDSTFAHSGITGLINTVYNGGAGTIAILDNRITAMTGHQGNPVNGLTLGNDYTFELNLSDLCKALGVARVVEVDPTNYDDVAQAFASETAVDELSVIIFKSPCILLTRTYPPALAVDVDICTGCKVCVGLGCPAIAYDKTSHKASIDGPSCRGCELCAMVCRFDAISSTKGDN